MKKDKVVIIGASGQLGFDFTKALKQHSEYLCYPFNHNQLDITKIRQVRHIIKTIKPNIVVNCAAFHKVERVELAPQKAFKINAIAQRNLAKMAHQYNFELCFISSDYVFGKDDCRSKPYSEQDLPGPVNVYGVSKLVGEYFTTSNCNKHFIIRTSGLYGIKGPSGKGDNFVDYLIRTGKNTKRIKVGTDQKLCFTYTKHIADNLIKLFKTKQYGLYHMVSNGGCNRLELAVEIYKQLKWRVVCEPMEKQVSSIVRRPAYSVLINQQLINLNLNTMTDWQTALSQYLKEKKLL